VTREVVNLPVALTVVSVVIYREKHKSLCKSKRMLPVVLAAVPGITRHTEAGVAPALLCAT